MSAGSGHGVWLEVLVEERSAEEALNFLLPAIVPGVEFAVRPHQGKHDLMRKLPDRLRGYAGWPEDTRVAILLDRDKDDCVRLKESLELFATNVGLPTLRTVSESAEPRVATRIAIEELEAWFFGDVPALSRAFPGVPPTLGQRAGYRDPDAITDTWERLERTLQQAGHHTSGLRKLEAAARIGAEMDVEVNQSNSFCQFRDGLRRLVGYQKARR